MKPDRLRKDKAEGTEKAAGNADFRPVLPGNYGIAVGVPCRLSVIASEAKQSSLSDGWRETIPIKTAREAMGIAALHPSSDSYEVNTSSRSRSAMRLKF